MSSIYSGKGDFKFTRWHMIQRFSGNRYYIEILNEIPSLPDLMNSFSTYEQNIDFDIQEKGINISSNTYEMLRG